ncbi:MAG: YfiR family protein [Opitutaceae bacterium]|nr:YfiR family protein [Cytophagales bacterium]
MLRRIFILLFLASFGFSSKAQLPDPVSRIKVMFLYNFTKYIEWPQDYKQGDFVIGVLGGASESLKKELEKLASTKKAGIQTIVVKNYNSVAEIEKCHLLFIPESKSNLLDEATAKCKKNSTLIVTEKDGLAKRGSAINFVVKDNKQNFELNKGNIERYNLNVSTNLLSLAIQVN